MPMSHALLIYFKIVFFSYNIQLHYIEIYLGYVGHVPSPYPHHMLCVELFCLHYLLSADKVRKVRSEN